MLAPQSHLEVRSRLPARATRKPPLVFIHGGYGDAWCWEPYFLPWFAAKGWPAYALSLRGHGSSSGAETLFIAGLATSNPDYASHFVGLDSMHLSDDVLKALRPFYFSNRVDPAILREAMFHLKGESARVLFDLALRLHWAPSRAPSPVFVMGTEGDWISIPDDVQATARHHHVDATILPGSGHMLMLEPEWKEAAEAIAEWLRDVG
jgi:pimeloyl-ACP methyl ester carboxylesterase